MKTIISLISLFALVCVSVCAQEPEIKNAQVTIPYSELKILLDAARRADTEKPQPKPPVDAVLTSAKYLLDLSGENPLLTADYTARTFTDDWHALPLFGGDPNLERDESSEATSIFRKDEFYTLLTKGVGEFTARLDLNVPPPAGWEKSNGLSFLPAPASQNELRVTGLLNGKTLRIEGLSPTRSGEGELIYHLPGDGKELRIFLEKKIEPAPILPSSWTLHSQVLIRYAEGKLKYSARVQAQSDSGSGLSMSLSLPGNVSRVTVEGEDLNDWKLAARTADSRLLKINWETRDMLDRTLLVNWEVPQSPLSDTWELDPLRVEVPEQAPQDSRPGDSISLIALLAVDGLELTHPSLQTAVESRRLPEWLREQLGSEGSLSAEITGEASIKLKANWLPRMETAQATVSLASFDTRLVADGSIIVSADYTIQHSAPINWTLELPSVDQILTCELNKKSINPIKRGDNEIEFRLPAPTTMKSANKNVQGTTIRLSYSLKTDPLDPVSGRVALELPRTDLFIHRLDWSVEIPGQFEPTAIEGNVQLSNNQTRSKSKSGSNLIHLEKELCRGEQPAVEIYYQRKNLDSNS